MRFITLTRFAIAALAFPAAAQTVTCDTDARGTESLTTLFDSPRPLLLPGSYTGRLSSSFLSLNTDPEGDGPREVAISPDGQTALVVNMGITAISGGTLSFIDIPTRTVTGSVNLGQLPVHVAVSPNGQYAVVPNVFTHDVTIVDLASRTVLHTVPVTGTQPFRAAVTPDSQFAVVSITNDAVNSAFSVIDLATGVEVRTIPSAGQGSIGGYATPEFAMSGPLFTQFAITPDGARIVLPYSATVGSAVKIYSIATGVETASIPVPASGRSIDISPDGTRAIIGHEGSTAATRVISVIDLTSDTLLVSHPVASMLGSQVIRITPDNTHAVAAISNNVIFVDLASGVTDATISTGTVGDIEILGNFAFVSNFNSSVINWTTRTLTASLTLAACVETAVTPVGNRVVALNSRFREDAHFYTIGGPNTADGFVATGPAPEGDCTKMLGITPDGNTLIACNTISRNVSIVDLNSSAVRAVVNTGDRVSGVNTTADSRYAVVANSDQSTVTIIDLTTDAAVSTLPIATRPWHVAMSPTGPTAAVLTVAGTDMIHWINVNGAASSVIGTTVAGQTGNILAYTYAETSGIAFNPSGTILAVCRSFDDQLRLIDASTRTVIADVTVGDFPIWVSFTPDGTLAYVSNAFSNTVSVVSINGASSTTIATITGFNSPLFPVIDAAGQYVYINNQGTNPRISVISTATNTTVANVLLSGGNPRDIALSGDGSKLFAAGADAAGGRFYVLSAAGPATAVEDSIALSGSPFDLAVAPGRPLIAVSQPLPDGVDLVSLAPPCDPDVNCDGAVNGFDVEATEQAVNGDFSNFCQASADLNGDGAENGFDIETEEQRVNGAPC
ncbi:Hydrazine synthase subunit beta [Phycisphaerales bacterium]|nr:Hydrazine synthase subunit beta [Phycisphaerales bacterium]